MIVIADTSPINYLVLIGHIEVLPQLYGRILIPLAVSEELLHTRTPESVRDWFRSAPEWLEMHAISQGVEPTLQLLGKGEREAITLAREIRADRILMDDVDARHAAEARKIRVIGTLGVLREAAQTGLLDLAVALPKLKQTSFFAGSDLIQRILDEEAARRRESG
jgi:predicted nucleic acid-binding protein